MLFARSMPSVVTFISDPPRVFFADGQIYHHGPFIEAAEK